MHASKFQRASRTLPIAAACGLLGLFTGPAASAPCAEPELKDAEIYVVYNATDEDAQIIIAGGSEGGLKKISIVGPRGEVDFDADFSQRPNIGQADFQFDSTEPSLGKLKRAYPSGAYRFSATTIAGCTLSSRVRLSYALLDAPVIVFPAESSTGVPAAGFTAMWEEIPDAETVHVAVEVEADGTSIEVDLAGDATSFDVPAGFLKRGVLYTMDVIGIAENGNHTVADVQFTTAP